MKLILENPWLRMLSVCALLVSLLMVTGCNGCSSKVDRDDVAKKKKEEEEEKKKKKKKPPFETRTPVVLPGLFPKNEEERKEAEDKLGDDPDALQKALANMQDPVMRFNKTKLGHWVSINFQAIANNYNADGQLVAYSMNTLGKPVPIPSTDYYLTTTRPVSLPKGEWKNLESSVYLPRRNSSVQVANVNYAIERNSGGLTQVSHPQPTSLMKPSQHHIVLLSTRPETYKFMEFADAIHLRGQQLFNGEMVAPFYLMVPSNPKHPIPLPRNALNWTTIAYLFWDDYDPASLSQEHQDALLDWLHFGGQIIVSGPDALDKLQTSFLAEYLPAQFEGSRNITNADLKELNENWTVPSRNNAAEKRIFQISEKVPLLGVTFKPHVDANFVAGTGEMAIERRVGRGRVVVTSFSVNAKTVRKWQSFPSFLHNALLRRPSRVFGKTESAENSFGWEFDRTDIFDPLMGTTLRFLSRDLSASGTPSKPVPVTSSPNNGNGFEVEYGVSEALRISRDSSVLRRDPNNYLHFGGYTDSPQSGVSGWNDNSGISQAARDTIKEAAGITPPSSDFVLKMLAAYLVVLVPINWLVFRLIGKVELAWVAAPFIAILGAVLVVKLASLDIGFVRSNTQIGLLEIHGDYPRAHVCEYSALYTSLSTRYNVDLDNPTAQSLPFARVDPNQHSRKEETLSQVKMRRTVKSSLEGFQIQSNSTGLLHTEFILDLDGILSCSFDDEGKPESISNGTLLGLNETGVVWRDMDAKYHLAWIGDLASGAVGDLELNPTTKNEFAERWRRNPVFSSSARAADAIWNNNVNDSKPLPLESVLEFPELADQINKYEVRLIQIGNSQERVEPVYSKIDFREAYRTVNVQSSVRIGRMFDTVVENLVLAPGECRMIGLTDQRLGRTKFDPDATQTDQQTLVVAHLKQPPLPAAKRDKNALVDFTGKSSLDYEAAEEALEAEFGN